MSATAGTNNKDRWLAPYAVLNTLLFGLFVVLYASSQADMAKLKSEIAAPLKPAASVPDAPSAEASMEKAPLEARLRDEIGSVDSVRLRTDERGLVISFDSLPAGGLYATGQTAIREELLPLLDGVGRALAGTQHLLRIEGFSDASEPEGWRISSARAAWVARYWEQKIAIEPSRMSVMGRAHFGDLPKGIDLRRVEIVLIKPKSPKSKDN